jgi:rhomboid family protein
MFPVSDVIPSRTTPYATIALLVLNAVGFIYELQLGSRQLQALVDAFGLVPAAFSWPSVLTSLFLHDGWLHFGVNMLYLWIFGDNVEDTLGHIRYLVFYLICGVAAATGHAAAHPHSTVPMIGASGAIAGILGAYLVLYPRSRVLTAIFLVVFLDLVEIPAIFFLGIWFVMQLFNSVGSIGAHAAESGVAFWAHVAGFVTGALGGLYWRLRHKVSLWNLR